ncbi:MAG: GNAT family protein [Acidimicrobiales bacterium]
MAQGSATRAVKLLMHHLAVRTDHVTATLLIHAQNERSVALATRAGFVPSGALDGSLYFKQPVPPGSRRQRDATDGVVTTRGQRAEDLDADLTAKDEEQIE